MDAIIVLLILGILAFAGVGAIWVLAKVLGFVAGLFAPERPAARAPRPPPIPQRPASPPAHLSSAMTVARTAAQSAQSAQLDRAEVLSVVRRELYQALNLRKISSSAYLELTNYLSRERDAVQARTSAPPEPESLPLLDLMEEASPASAAAPDAEPLPAVTRIPAAEQPPSQRNPDRMRAAIAKLHADAQAPAAPEPAPNASAHEVPAETVKHAKPATVAPAAAAVSKKDADAKPGELFAPRKTLAERFFTPENVRILQSLGITIFFISAVAFVRTQMWNDASPLARLLILVSGTVACTASGFALRRWLSLRITGLGFMVLGQLALVLDAYSTLIDTGGGRGIYPYSPQSLWTYAFLLFTLSACVTARWIREPLFDAFAYFGALATWAAGALWLGVEPLSLPAVFVPALIVSGILAHRIHPVSQPAKPMDTDEPATAGLSVPRWSLPWWLGAGFEAGSVLLAAALPICALLSGRASLTAHFALHAGAVAGLAAAMLAGCALPSKLSSSPMPKNSLRHAAALLFLSLLPLAAYAFEWPAEWWPAAFAAPGAVLALLALVIERRSSSSALAKVFRGWGLVPVLAGMGWSVVLRVGDVSGTASFVCGGAALAVALAYALWREAEWGPPWATAAAAFLAWLGLDAAHVSMQYAPAAGLMLALCGHGFWTATRSKIATSGRWSADFLALAAGVYLFALTPVLPGSIVNAPVGLSISAGWVTLFLFAMATSIWGFANWRCALGIAFASPALCYGFYHFGAAFGAPAPWLALLAMLAVLYVRFGETSSEKYGPALGAAAILTHGILLAAWQSWAGLNVAAGVSFALLSLPLMLHAQFQRARGSLASPRACEIFALLLLAAGGVNAAWAQQLLPMEWPLALTVLAAAILALARVGELVARRWSPDEAPFRTAGEITALALSAAAFAVCIGLSGGAPADRALLLTTIWICGLLPSFIAVRGMRSKSPSLMTAPGEIGAAAFALLAFIRTAQAQFWLAACPAGLRGACAVFFGVVLALSALGIWRRGWLAPVSAALAGIGLLGCAIGQGLLPPQAFGLGCMTLAIGIAALKRLYPSHGFSVAADAGAWLTRGAGVLHLLFGLAVWPAGAVHALPLLAWVVLALEARADWPVLAATALLPACAEAMRWLGLDFDRFGPGLAALAVVLSMAVAALRATPRSDEAQAAPDQSALNGIGIAAKLAGMFAFGFGLWGAFNGHAWLWSVTLAEFALGFFVAAIDQRRAHALNGAAPARMRNSMGLEVSSWMMLTGAIYSAFGSGALDIPLPPPLWVLFAAVYLLLGMAGEALVPLLAGERAPQAQPAYLESRHVAALALCLIGLIQAFNHSTQEPAVHNLWRVLFGMSALAIYGSFARSTADASISKLIQKVCVGAAYVVLMPAAYLCFLIAHSNGGSWGALYLMLLVPVQLAAAMVLRHEKREDQAELALIGVHLVGAGALLLAFIANRAQLAQVPAATLLALGAAMAALRALTGRRWYSAGSCVALAASVFYAAQACAGLSLFSPLAPWAWQIVFVSLLSLVLMVLGGALKIDAARGMSRVAVSGMVLNAAAVIIALMFELALGSRAAFPPWPNMDHLDALIACVLLLAAAGLCATRWLRDWEPLKHVGRYIAPAAAITGYALFMFKNAPAIWEPYTLPIAFFLFGWAREVAREHSATDAIETGDSRELNVMLAFASAMLTLPSFLQAIPHSKAGMEHYVTMMSLGLVLVFGAMLSRRKVPLLAGAGTIVTGTILKAIQWAQHREGLAPLLGILLGLLLLGVSTLFESRMNRAFRKAVDKARAEARMFWVSWQ